MLVSLIINLVYSFQEAVSFLHVVKESHILSSNGSGHGALAVLLKEEDVDTLICGGIGVGAQNALADANITVYGGVQGEADVAVNDFIAGKLAYDPAVHCNHHDYSAGQGGGSNGCGEHGDGHKHMHQHGKQQGKGDGKGHGRGVGNGHGQNRFN